MHSAYGARTCQARSWVDPISPPVAPRHRAASPVFPGHLALENENSYVSAAEWGLGIAQMPAFIVKEAMERGIPRAGTCRAACALSSTGCRN